jgi:hypothetical protein
MSEGQEIPKSSAEQVPPAAEKVPPAAETPKTTGERLPEAGDKPLNTEGGKVSAVLDNTKGVWAQSAKRELHADVGVPSSSIKVAQETLKNAPAEGKEAAQNALDAMTKPKTEAFAKLGKIDKITAAVGGNIGQAKGWEKAGRIGGSVVGLGVIISGTKNLIAPQRDENGERKGSAWKQVGKIAGGAALTYLSAVKGGANKAMGIS